MSKVYRDKSIIYLETDDGQRYYYDESRAPLGSGAMGTVYLGYNYKTRELVAVKRVKDQYSSIQGIRHRAKQEAAMMFSHYNLVEMLGMCEVYPDKGPIFIISRYVKGETIDCFVKSRLYSLAEPYKKICEMFYPICDALDYLHSQGIVHADIKPSNIMVEAGHNVRLMDLGIAQVYSGDGSSGTKGMMGTPRYAAPEQFSVSSHSSNSLTARTDIYELSVTIYELLAKENPFQGSSLQETREKHEKGWLPYIPDVPKTIVDVLRIAVSPNPSDRYQSAKEFKAALRNALFAKPQKRMWTFILVIAVIILLVIGFLYIFQ